MEIPLLDLKGQYESIKEEIDEALARVINSQCFILSNEVSFLEQEIADYIGVSGGAGVASGTDAIILALRASGLGEGDFVITSPFTFFATAEAISVLGAVPLFVDIDPKTYNIDPEKIEHLLRRIDSKIRTRIKAVLPVHLYGQCADMDSIMEIAEKYQLKIIEDCAQAFGAGCNSRQAGSFGRAGCLSFFPSKNLGSFGDGGMVVSSDMSLIEKIKLLRAHGSNKQYIHEEVAYNSRLDSIQAAVLRVKLKKIDMWIKKRREIARKYDDAFSETEIDTPIIGKGNMHTYHQYTIALDARDELLKYLTEKSIGARVYYPLPLHLQPCYKALGYQTGSLPIAERMTERILSLPVYPELTNEKVEYIIQTVKTFLKSKRSGEMPLWPA